MSLAERRAKIETELRELARRVELAQAAIAAASMRAQQLRGQLDLLAELESAERDEPAEHDEPAGGVSTAIELDPI